MSLPEALVDYMNNGSDLVDGIESAKNILEDFSVEKREFSQSESDASEFCALELWQLEIRALRIKLF